MAREKRVIRYSKIARFMHWSNLLSIVVLLYTGLALYLPVTNVMANFIGGFYVSRLLHRIAILTLIFVPLIVLPFTWNGFKHWMRELFTWEEGDSRWILKMPVYLFRPSAKMPPVLSKMTSGQRIITFIMIFAIFVQIATGLIMGVLRPLMTKSLILWASLFHDVGTVVIIISVGFHAYVGLGGFKPYRGVWRGMFGDGTVDYKRAKHLWPKWTDESQTIEK